ncbi:MAG: NAD-dependent epimerase/dehydratase family protein [Bacteroidales bacterium]|nr:NAD-dependent epimerase/dehydratase family protein [Bacteroidales bacterium]
MILVTGGTGLVGSWLLFQLTQKHDKVRAIKRQTSSMLTINEIFQTQCKDPQHLLDKIEWLDGDVLNLPALENAMEGVSQIYHCAATVSFLPADREHMMRINVEGTANMVNLALHHKIAKFCFVSSVAAIGRSANQTHFTEDADWTPSKENSWYAKSKFEAEQEVWRGIEEGLKAVIVNPSIILGYGSPGQGSAKLFEEVWEGLKFFTSGVNGFVDVRDVADIMIKLMESPIRNQRFIVCSENISYKTLFELIASSLGVKAPLIHAKPWMGELYWRIEAAKFFISKRKPTVTRETARTASKQHLYSNEKIKEAINYKFISIIDTIGFHAKIFLKNWHQKSKS